MSQRCLHSIVILLIILRILRIGSFAIDGLAPQRVSRLFQHVFGTLFVFEKNETERSSLLFDLIHGCLDLGDLEGKQIRSSTGIPATLAVTDLAEFREVILQFFIGDFGV